MKQFARVLCLSICALASGVSHASTIVAATSSDGNELIHGDQPIAGSATLNLTFNNSLPATSAITLTGPNGMVPVSVATVGQSLAVKPQQQLLPASRYTLFVKNDGEPLQHVSFSTAALAQTGSPSSGSATTTYLRAGTDTSCSTPSTKVPGFRFCAESGVSENGFFHPGASNAGGHWRLNVPLPEVPPLSDFAIPSGVTAVYGVVRRIDDAPLARVTVSVGTHVGQTDESGRFVLQNVPSGHQKLTIDGSSANRSGEEYGQFNVSMDLVANRATGVPFNLFLPRISEDDKLSVPSPTITDTVLTHPAIPGFEIHLPAGTVLRDHAGNVLTQIAIVPMPVDRSPVPVPDNFTVYYSLQPGDLSAQSLTPEGSQGITVVYPNYTGEKRSGQKFWYYDADRAGWTTYAYGRISDDGKSIVGISKHGVLNSMPAGAAVGGPQNPGQDIKDSCDGDPVDCSTGVYFQTTPDLVLHDISDVAFGHRYNSSDLNLKSFGRGGANPFGLYVHSPTSACTGFDNLATELDLVDSDGRYYRFLSTPGGAPSASVFRNTSDPGPFYGASLYLLSTEKTLLQLRDGTQYVFNNGCPSNLESISDRFGNTLSMSYTAGLLSQITTPGGKYFKLSYNAANFISSVTDSAGRSISYSYVGNNLDTVTYPDSTTERYSYDTSGNLLTVTDRRGIVSLKNHYDANNRVDKQTFPDLSTYQFSYTLNAGVVVATDITNSRGYVKHIAFDSGQFATTVTKAYGTSFAQQVTFARNANELITDVTDAIGRKTHYTYDTLGNVLTKTLLYGTPKAANYTYTYTPDTSQLATSKDPLGHTTTFSYTNGCLASAKDALGHTTTVICNSAGQTVTVKDALNHTTSYSYQGVDVRSVTDALNNVGSASTDGIGNIVSQSDPQGRLRLSSYRYDNRMSSSTDALGQLTHFTYDGVGNLTDVVDANGGHTKYGYDSRNGKNSHTDALNQSESWTRDGQGNLLTYTDRNNQTTNYQYDPLDRLSLITYIDGSTVNLTYDLGNRLTSVVDSVSGTINRTYDGLNNLTQEQSPQGTVNFTYDLAGRPASMTPAAQAETDYTFDNANRLTQIKQGTAVVAMGYDNGNRRTSLTLPNGVVTSYAYDNANELTSLTYKNSGGATLASTTYTYNPSGDRLSRTGGFGTDLLPTPTTGSNTFNSNNQQTTWNGFLLSFDPNGNPTNDASTSPSTSYTFDVRHRLTQILQGSVVIATFQYDSFGRRIQKTVAGATTNFLYAGENIVQESRGSTNAAVLTGLNIDERFARDEVSGKRYFLTDAIGSVVALTDDSQAVEATFSYEPFGEVSTTGSSDNPYQYTGRENDGTGLYYYRARYYSPKLKRFISDDPAGLTGGINTYLYANANPLTFRDPSGLWPPVCYSHQILPNDAPECYGTVPPKPYPTLPKSYYHPPCDCFPLDYIRWPDFVQFEISTSVVTGGAVYTRSGEVFLTGGLSLPGAPKGEIGVSIADGWVLGAGCNPSPRQINSIVNGQSAATNFYAGLGGGMSSNFGSSTGTFTVGVGVGYGSGGYSTASDQGNVFQ